jgi:hypothetical protein
MDAALAEGPIRQSSQFGKLGRSSSHAFFDAGVLWDEVSAVLRVFEEFLHQLRSVMRDLPADHPTPVVPDDDSALLSDNVNQADDVFCKKFYPVLVKAPCIAVLCNGSLGLFCHRPYITTMLHARFCLRHDLTLQSWGRTAYARDGTGLW